MDLTIKKDPRSTKFFHKVPRGIYAKQTQTIAIRDMDFVTGGFYKQNYIHNEGLILQSHDILEQCNINGLPEKYS